MRKLTKISLITALVLFLTGTLLLAGGLVCGANHRDFVKGLEKNSRFQNFISRFTDRDWDALDELDALDRLDELDQLDELDDIESWQDWRDFWDDWGHEEGDYHHIEF